MKRPRHRPKSLGDVGLIVVVAFVYLRLVVGVGGWGGVGLLVLGFLAIGLAALRWGADSRDGLDDTSLAARREAANDRRAELAARRALSPTRARG
jgi:hypothetical protein